MWSTALTDTLNTNDLLSAELRSVNIETDFPTSYLSQQLRTVAKIIASKTARGVDVDTFYVEVGGEIVLYFSFGWFSFIHVLTSVSF